MALNQIPPYQGGGTQEDKKKESDVVSGEYHRLSKELKAERKKRHKAKWKYKDEKVRRKATERTLETERSSTAAKELAIRLQTKLDDLAFYREGEF